MNLLRQDVRDIPNYASPKEIDDHASLRGAKDQMRSTDSRRDINDSVRSGIAYSITG
jgi:hypothetical protein